MDKFYHNIPRGFSMLCSTRVFTKDIGHNIFTLEEY